MPATLTTLDSVLKEFYLGPIQDQLNNEVLALDLMEKASVDWSGKRVIIPVHTSRNSGVGYRGEGGTLPTAGQQGFSNLTVNAEFLYGRFQVSGPAIAAAKTGGKNSFISYVDAEMTKLVSDIRNEANQRTFAGGRVVGYLNEKKTKGVNLTWEFSGDSARLDRMHQVCRAAAAGPFELAVLLVRCDTLETISAERLRDDAVPSTAVDQSAGTIEFVGAVDTRTDINGATVPPGTAIAVVVRYRDQNAGVQARIDDGTVAFQELAACAGTGNAATTVQEPLGVFSCLHDQEYFGLGTGAAGGVAAGQIRDGSGELIGTGHCTLSADDSRAGLSLGELQRLIDQLDIDSGEAPDVMLVHPVFRQAYAGLMIATANNNNNLVVDTTSAGKGDAGFSAFSFNNIPFKSSRHCPKGMVVALHTPSWKLTELESGGFADLDGAVLSRTANADNWEGFYRWYYNQVCLRPNANGVLVGFSFPGSAAGA